MSGTPESRYRPRKVRLLVLVRFERPFLISPQELATYFDGVPGLEAV